MSTLDSIQDQIAGLIRKAEVFPSADDACIRSLAEVAVWLTIPGGATLCSQGEPSDTMYIAVNGLLGVYVRGNDGEEVLAGRIGPGELVGEMGCVTGEKRSATIRALRTTEVLSVAWEACEPVARAHPNLLVSLCRTVANRLRNVQEGRAGAKVRPKTFCVMPHGSDRGVRPFVNDLLTEFGALGQTYLVTKEACADYTTDRLVALETKHEFVIYLADVGLTAWSRLCLRQADSVIIAVQGADEPQPIPPLDAVINPGIPIDMVFLWESGIVAGKTPPWLDLLKPNSHYHVRSRADAGRAARLMTGNGLGLVLSGGGARGFAHLGINRVFQDHGVPIDAVIGTSMGALVGAAIAMEWDLEYARTRAHKFSRRHPLLELVIPRRSLLSGRNLRTSLEDWFGNTEIEETPIRYTCVSVDLNTCTAAAHSRGKLKTWIRASASLPGIFPPVIEKAGLYIDGGVANNLPTDIARDLGVNYVVAVDVGLVPEKAPSAPDANSTLAEALPNILDLLMRVGTIGSDVRGITARQQCDVLLVPKVRSVGLMNFRAYDEAIKLGYDCALEKIDQIKRRIPDKRTANALGL
jgi:NTE family protein